MAWRLWLKGETLRLSVEHASSQHGSLFVAAQRPNDILNTVVLVWLALVSRVARTMDTRPSRETVQAQVG